VLLIIFSGGESTSSNGYSDLLPNIDPASLLSLINFDSQIFTLLIIVIGAAWTLILVDRFLKKIFLR
jgi:hypothetical protein